MNHIMQRLAIFTTIFTCALAYGDDNDWQETPHTMPQERPSPFTHTAPPLTSRYWLGLGIGGAKPSVQNPISVINGSSFLAPANVDRLTTSTKNTGMIDLNAGQLWTRTSTWMPAYSLGLRYRYIPSTNIGNQVLEFSSPRLTNYRYDLKVGAQLATVQAKLDFYRYEAVMAYIGAGLGIGFNTTFTYKETLIAPVTRRVSPGFTSHTEGNFTYNLGAGFDFIINPCWTAFLGYEYQSVGATYSGYGVGTWGTSRLKLSHFRTNSVLFGVNYLL